MVKEEREEEKELDFEIIKTVYLTLNFLLCQ